MTQPPGLTSHKNFELTAWVNELAEPEPAQLGCAQHARSLLASPGAPDRSSPRRLSLPGLTAHQGTSSLMLHRAERGTTPHHVSIRRPRVK